jgi:uncharacterized protein (UPF0179 family)
MRFGSAGNAADCASCRLRKTLKLNKRQGQQLHLINMHLQTANCAVAATGAAATQVL